MSAFVGPRSRILTTHRVLSAPFEWMPRWRDRYGDPFRLPTMNGTVTLTGRPELIKQIFAGNPSGYSAFAVEAIGPFTGKHSLLLMSGEPHRRERKLLMPPFHGERMRALGDLMAESAARQAERVCGAETTTMEELGKAISLEAIIRAVFGVQDQKRVDAFAQQIVALLQAANPMMFFFTSMQSKLFPPWNRYQRLFAAFDHMLQEQIEVARKEPGNDILSLMLAARYDDGEAMPDPWIRDELRTLLFAGHETTAVALGWAIDELHRNEAELHGLRKVIDALPDAAEAYAAEPALEHVWKETLRLHPAVTEALRKLEAPLTLDGKEIPVGETVAACMALTHFDPELYPEPARFRPARFAERRYTPYEYLPFGGGHRRCLGATFAAYELQIVLGVLLRNYTFELVHTEPPAPKRRNVTLGPSDGVPVRIRPRAR